MNKLSQTLQEKSPHLEVSVLKLSEVKKDNESFRIESFYFQKKYFDIEAKIRKIGFKYLSDICLRITDGTHYTPKYIDSGVIFLSSLNIDENYLNIESGYKYISEYEHRKLSKRCLPQEHDILLRKIGGENIYACVVPKLKFEFSIFVSIALVRIDTKLFNPYFVSTFINSKYGRYQLIRQAKGIAQLDLHLEDLRKIKIPIFPMSFQLEVEKLVKDSHKALESSKALYKEAEALLYEALGLDSKNPLQSILHSHYESLPYRSNQNENSVDAKSNQSPNTTIATLKESFLKTGRLDAEYYQEKYYIMEEKLKKNGFVILDEICSLINYGSVPTSPYTDNGKGIPYIKGLNLKNLQVDENKLDRITNTQDLDSKFFTKENDIIISQMGTVGDVGVVSKDQENYVFASFTIRIRLKDTQKFNPYFVAIYIQHIAKEWYLLRNIAQASVRQNTDLPTIKNLYVPIIDSTTQIQIATHIQKSFELRAEAKSLLESAKAKVESALNNANSAGGGG